LNFTWKDDVDIITGRTWEVLSSGTLLLQNDSMILDGLFEEGVHYIAFSSKEDLLARLSFLVENPTYAETIANSGYQRYKELIDVETFWTNLIR
jgi:spore maturation protein CgeB